MKKNPIKQNLFQFDNNLITRLSTKGVPPDRVSDFIVYVSKQVTSGTYMGLKGINFFLNKSEWKGITLDHTSFLMILEALEKTSSIDDQDDEVIDDYDGLSLLVDKVYKERGFDFRNYCKASLSRKVSRFLFTQDIQSYGDYIKLLDNDPQAYDRLLNEMTINFTEFFRDMSAFEELNKLLRQHFENNDQLKIWSAGCATGQEPYTIAMLILNIIGDLKKEVSIIATDIDSKVLTSAQKGIYDELSIKGMKPDWLDRFFIKKNNVYEVRQQVKDLIHFDKHNLVTDLPYENIDIITCRNVIIYFNLPLQSKIFYKFYKALNQKGHILLGRYEMMFSSSRQLFSCVNFDSRLYRKK
ncbi:chemotaxis protein CheR [Candidatus Magnetomorum sp. HK-1]|nr:chemotaxis protein CheR [Candidatus Magnetomorum sp. HK-1]